MNLPRSLRTWHRRISILFALPLLLVILSGLLLHTKKHWTFVQPAAIAGAARAPAASWDAILEALRDAPGLGVGSWSEIKRLDYRIDQGMAKIQLRNSLREVQVDMESGRVLQVATRRSDLIEDLHTGAFFSENVRLLVFIPCAAALLFLWISGVYLFVKPHLNRRARNAAGAAKERSPAARASGGL